MDTTQSTPISALRAATKAGFEENAGRARLLYDAFQRSYCSIEVKGKAREVAASYDLLEEPVA